MTRFPYQRSDMDRFSKRWREIAKDHRTQAESARARGSWTAEWFDNQARLADAEADEYLKRFQNPMGGER